ncbi:RHS repeat-associated core domain-containing protein [Chromobacterium sp. CV08]|uniref:RHS repeat-associated core domain-containing protein n=1 Tax=Chromobacterium sp. CV08 TaxID=3133274 RepID=UPI003DA8DA11
MDDSVLGWNGERRDPVSGASHLGNGYRAYSPALMRFHCPDSLSPFGAGGVNPYAYCAGDPVDRADPSGHLSWQAWTMMGLGVAGLGLAAITKGISIVASGGIIAALESASAASLAIGGAAVVADAAAIASGITERSDPKASAVLGWVSLSAGILSLGAGLASSGYRLLAQARRAGDTMTMSLDDEFLFIAALGRTTRRGALPDAIMSVVFEDRFADASETVYRRLNIWAHGRRPDRIFINGRALTVDQLLDQLIASGIDVTDYGVVRFLTCDSVNLARAFTRATSLTATGFRGEVTVQGHTVTALRQISREIWERPVDIGTARVRFAQAAHQYPDNARLSGVNIFEDHEFFRVARGHPVSFRSLPEQEELIEQTEGYPLPGWSIDT